MTGWYFLFQLTAPSSILTFQNCPTDFYSFFFFFGTLLSSYCICTLWVSTTKDQSCCRLVQSKGCYLLRDQSQPKQQQLIDYSWQTVFILISAISKRVQSWTAALLDPPHSREINDHRGIKISDHWRLNRPLPREVAPLEDPEPKNLKKKNTIGDTGLCIYFMMTFLKKKTVKDGFTWEFFQRWGFAPLRSGSFIINILNFKKFPPDPVKLIFFLCMQNFTVILWIFSNFQVFKVYTGKLKFCTFFQAFYQRHRHANPVRSKLAQDLQWFDRCDTAKLPVLVSVPPHHRH